MSRRQFTKEFKLAAIRRLEEGVPPGEVARALEVNPNLLHHGRGEFRQGPGPAFPGKGQRRWPEGRIAEWERKIGQQALEIDFWKATWICALPSRALRCRGQVTDDRASPRNCAAGDGR
jgi:transposase